MNILGIETSCDETAAAVVRDGTRVLSNIIATSKHMFASSGGVIPEQAARKQVECMIPVIERALKEAKIKKEDINAIAVTTHPGLLGSLLVGTTTARTLASVCGKRLIEVNHTLGHLSSTFLESPHYLPFPILALSVSGGHTELWYRESHTKGILLGQTRDDAAGEAFDKGASLLGLGYPGGPAIAKAAEHGDPHTYDFPLPLKGEPGLDYSFSGLKTALKYLLQSNVECRMSNVEYKKKKPNIRYSIFDIQNLAASYQHAICLHLVDRIRKALATYPRINEIHIVGGVSANTHLRSMLTDSCKDHTLRFPVHLSYCTDNAAMIACAAYFILKEQCSEH